MAPDRRQPASSSPIRPQTVWWVVAGLLFVISLYLIFRSATASYSVPPGGGTQLRQVACQSVYGWVRGQGVPLTSSQVTYLTADQKAAYYACHAAIGDRETTIKVLLGVAVVFAFIGYGADLRDAGRAERRPAA